MASERWQAIWTRRGTLARLLWPASLLYGAIGTFRRWLYRQGMKPRHRLPVPVIVVGNVVVGGAGKTPTVIALLSHLQASGWRPGVISRGYGRLGHQVLEVTDKTLPEHSGDEPALIHRRTGVPVVVAPRRADAGRALLAAHPEVNLLLCDDGLQHLALERDLAIAVFDERGTGNGWQLPAGLLREPWPPVAGSAFQPDLLLHQHRSGAARTCPDGDANIPDFHAERRLADTAWGPGGSRIDLKDLRARPLTAVAGIARPEAFFSMLRERGLHIVRTIALADHASPREYRVLEPDPGSVLVCTEKDAVKLFAQLPHDRQAWAIPLVLEPETAFWNAFDALLRRRTARR
ncbi:MAG: tetraacyldisaccharide 4'-kinase [Hydrogenophaga sp.]